MTETQDDDFDIFDMALLEEKENKDRMAKTEPITECEHINIRYDGQNANCLDCRESLNNISKQKEWRNFSNDTSSRSQTRCHERKKSDKNIYKDVEGMDFPEPIVFTANQMYKAVTGGKTRRANNRQAIIFGCVFRAYKLDGNPKSLEQIRAVFPLTEKVISRGMKIVGLNIHKYKNNKKTPITYITANNLIPEIMEKFNAKPEHIEEVLKLYEQIKNKSSIINRSRPQSIAISLIYYYITKTKRNITMEEYTAKVNLSEPTIQKINKEIDNILKRK